LYWLRRCSKPASRQSHFAPYTALLVSAEAQDEAERAHVVSVSANPKSLFDLTAALMVWLGLAGLVAGCRVVQSTAEFPGKVVQAVTGAKSAAPVVDPVALQQQVMRFADDFSGRIISTAEHLRRGTNAPDRLEIQKLRLAYLSDTLAVAAGPNAVANLLDMAVLVSMSRKAVEEHWEPQVYGESARPMLEACQRSEAEIWQLATTVLKSEQLAELHKAIDACQPQPDLATVLSTRALTLAGETSKSSPASRQAVGSVFSLLMLDPLAGLDPAARELAQARLVADRALFLGTRMPLVLRWQVEVLGQNLASLPEMQQALTNTTQLAGAADRLSRVAEQLPERAATERKELLAALDAQGGKLTSLASELRLTLDAGGQMFDSLKATLVTFDGLMKRFGVCEPTALGQTDTHSRPFDVLDYGRSAKEIAAMAQQLDTTLRSFNGTLDSPVWTQRLRDFKIVSGQAQADARGVLNHGFLLGAGLVVVFFGGALIYRLLTFRFTRRLEEKNRETK
jgi:hypothetical protein